MRKRGKIIRHSKSSRVVLYVLLAFTTFLFLLPFWTLITTSLKSVEEVALGRPAAFPSHPTLEPYLTAFGLLKKPLLNTLIFASAATILSCFIGSITAYSLSKVRFKGDVVLFLLLIFTAFIPFQAVLVPLVLITSKIGIYNTIKGMILVHTIFTLPLSTLLFRNFYVDFPDALIMAAKMDGAGIWKVWRYIVFPLSLPPFAVSGTLLFTMIWNDYLFGLVLTKGAGAMPATVMLANLKGTYCALWNVQMAGVVWVVLPILIIYIVLGKYIIRGYMAGATSE